jgi:hypothetical protein
MSKGKCKVERVLIVAKTHMHNAVCVSGLTIGTNRSIRLLRTNGFNQQVDTPFDVGQVWELEFHPSPQLLPLTLKMSLSRKNVSLVIILTWLLS